jgi:hypothetical protein
MALASSSGDGRDRAGDEEKTRRKKQLYSAILQKKTAGGAKGRVKGVMEPVHMLDFKKRTKTIIKDYLPSILFFCK